MIDGRITRWQIHTVYLNPGSPEDNYGEVHFASGYIWGDSKRRFPDGHFIRTTALRSIQRSDTPDCWLLLTLNSCYMVDNHERVDRSDPIVQERTFARPRYLDRQVVGAGSQ